MLQGELAGPFRPAAWVLGLVGFPAALLFYGASMLLAALRGYGVCEVLAVSDWLLGRDDQVGCVVFSPIDQLEHHLRR